MPLIPDAEPLTIAGGRDAVLLLHGFTGSPKSMKPWGRDLAAHGYSVSVPRLPGHGTTWQELNKIPWSGWYAQAERSLADLRREHDTVFVAALSMGGSLALRLAEEHPEDVAGLALVNPAVFTNRPDKYLLPVIKHVIGGWPGITNDINREGVDEGGYNRIPTRAAHSVLDLWRVTREDLPRVTAPLLVFTSVEDHVVEPENSTYIIDHVASETRRHVTLHNSYHVATLDHDDQLIFDTSREFFDGLASPH